VPDEDHAAPYDLVPHQLPWFDFDELARGDGRAETVRLLRRAERSRRLLLLRALVDEVSKGPDLTGPLPSPDAAWELLARAQDKDPRVLDLMLAHPYTGSWVGYTTRLLHSKITGVCPLWMHIGHIHALAAATAIRAGISFESRIPLWNGTAILPTLGVASLAADTPHSVAAVRGVAGSASVSTATQRVVLPTDHEVDAPGWWGIRRLVPRSGRHRLVVRLDDLDPYRGLYEPLHPQRLDGAEVDAWRTLLDQAWGLVVRFLPDIARAVPAALDSLVPRPAVPFGSWSASTGEAFGSAVVARPLDAYDLAATLVHEFQHIRLGGLLHLTGLHVEDSRERFYTPWRNDPRPVAGVLHGVYAFFGVTQFWRAAASADTEARGRALFEFAYWRAGTWRTLKALRIDRSLTAAGRRFVDGIAQRLGPWQSEPVPTEIGALADAAASDHYAGWRLRHIRPKPDVVAALAESWLSGRRWPINVELTTARAPTPVPDGAWSHTRTELIRRRLSGSGQRRPTESEIAVPGATEADLDYATGRWGDAARGYLAELASQADRPAPWIGLGLALSASGARPAAARALLQCPELVRAVYRQVHDRQDGTTPDELAAWIGRYVH
jgi:HEXXH motif-containing protein